MSLAPSSAEVEKAAARLVAALKTSGLILSHDTDLPSATTLIAGSAVRGSWWGHPKGKLIYAVLSGLEGDVTWVKLVKGKDTIVHRRLWPALISAGRSRQSWQTDGLGDDARAVLARIDEQADPLRSEEIELLPGSRKLGAIVTDLERRLLLHADSLHTESGQHTRVLETWSRFRKNAGILARELPKVGAALETLAGCVRRALGRSDVSRLLPWKPG